MTDPHAALTALICEHSGLSGVRAERLARRIAAEWAAVQPVVDRDTLASALLHVQHPDNPDRPLPMVRAGCAGVLADALLASGVIADAADVRHAAYERGFSDGEDSALRFTPPGGR